MSFVATPSSNHPWACCSASNNDPAPDMVYCTTTVTCTPLDSLNRFSPLLLDFLNKKTTVELPDRAAKGILAKEWYTVPRTNGGLGLPTLSATTRSLQLNLFFGGLRQIRQHPGKTPKWLNPAITLFSQALVGHGCGMDILYLHLRQPARFGMGYYGRILGPYLHQVLCTWNQAATVPSVATMNMLDLFHIPFWITPSCTTTQQPLRTLTKTAGLFTALQSPLAHLWDFVQGGYNLPTAFTDALFWLAPSRTALMAGTAIARHLEPLTARILDIPSGPTFQAHLNAAHHAWTIDGSPVESITAFKIRKQLHQVQPPSIQLTRLGVHRQVNWPQVWQRELSLDRHLLPIFGDIKFRLQHNALGFLYKFAWRHGSTNCVHGCDTPETAIHLFWDCPHAKRIWKRYLTPLEFIFGRLGWQDILFTDSIRLKEEFKKQPQDGFFVLLQFVRAICFRQLWLQRNLLLYNEAFPDTLALDAEIQAYMWLHIQAHFKRIDGQDKRKYKRFYDILRRGGDVYKDFLPKQQSQNEVNNSGSPPSQVQDVRP
ncbi:hypothetical protein AaE_015326 [Aphanomyces astaci]|uniref:Reverse transcriptase zinc-binding domain-containing protein n=1 Tax=Aphanomyces astaci TaxID=112090 RepID=A0A6A4YWE0_APHAT|nr:hypothetical protein AaE_015326 [Aphanomyces astaci]